MDAIAAQAGVQHRTILRHLESKEELLRAFWPCLNARIGSSVKPTTSQQNSLHSGGELTLRQFGNEGSSAVIHASAGISVRTPSRVPHNSVNESNKSVRMLLVMIEASMVAFFRDIGTAEHTHEALDLAQIGAAQKHGIEAFAAAA